MRKPAFCICENEDADQLHGNRADDPQMISGCAFVFPTYIKQSHLLLPDSEISSL